MKKVAAVVQFRPEKGKCEGNLDRICEAVSQCATEGSDLVLLPEGAVSGYFLEGAVNECAFSEEALAHGLESRLEKLDKSVEIILGYYQSLNGNVFNSQGVFRLQAGKISCLASYQKFFLATYGVFDEERFVSRGTSLKIVNSVLGKTGLMICEDVWHSIWPTLNAAAGATVMAISAASPGRGFSGDTVSNHDRYHRLVRAISEEHGVYSLLAQLVGFEGGKGFVGGSLICDPNGHEIVSAPVGQEAIIMAEIDDELVSLARARCPLISDLGSVWSGIRQTVNEIGG